MRMIGWPRKAGKTWAQFSVGLMASGGPFYLEHCRRYEEGQRNARRLEEWKLRRLAVRRPRSVGRTPDGRTFLFAPDGRWIELKR